MDFMKKKLEQQHEEELERKDAIKKQLERKVTFLPNELMQYVTQNFDPIIVLVKPIKYIRHLVCTRLSGKNKTHCS